VLRRSDWTGVVCRNDNHTAHYFALVVEFSDTTPNVGRVSSCQIHGGESASRLPDCTNDVCWKSLTDLM
jgi:hypothetical protein